MNMRSRISENDWMKDLSCKIIRMEDVIPLQRVIEIVSKEIDLSLLKKTGL